MSALNELIAKVREQGDVVSSAVALIAGMRAELVDLKGKLVACGMDPAVIESLTAELDSYGDRLAEAVAANTVAEVVAGEPEVNVEAPVEPEPVLEPESPVEEAPVEVPVEAPFEGE